MTADHKKPLSLATGALWDIISRAQAMQAATMREAPGDEIEAMRSEAHSVLDAYLDHMTSAATAVRSLIKD